jgi:hypothetical protein
MMIFGCDKRLRLEDNGLSRLELNVSVAKREESSIAGSSSSEGTPHSLSIVQKINKKHKNKVILVAGCGGV